MKAWQLPNTVGIDSYVLNDIPEPEPGPGEVRVQIYNSGLNHLDIWVAMGLPAPKDLPHTGGSDAAGVIDAVGQGVAGFVNGDEIIIESSYHPVNFEGGGPAVHSRASLRLLETQTGVFTPEQVERMMPTLPPEEPSPGTPGGKLDAFRGWIWLAALLLGYPLGHSIVTRGFGTSWTIDAYNVTFLVAALLLHGRPLPFLRACRGGVSPPWPAPWRSFAGCRC